MFVYPYLICCVEVCGHSCDIYLDPINKIQKEMCSCHYFFIYLEPTKPIFKKMKILHLKKLLIQRILLLMFKNNVGLTPKNQLLTHITLAI